MLLNISHCSDSNAICKHANGIMGNISTGLLNKNKNITVLFSGERYVVNGNKDLWVLSTFMVYSGRLGMQMSQQGCQRCWVYISAFCDTQETYT